jgi:hypothetical protein
MVAVPGMPADPHLGRNGMDRIVHILQSLLPAIDALVRRIWHGAQRLAIGT